MRKINVAALQHDVDGLLAVDDLAVDDLDDIVTPPQAAQERNLVLESLHRFGPLAVQLDLLQRVHLAVARHDLVDFAAPPPTHAL